MTAVPGDTTVVVMGAGLAGLAAATTLTRAGLDVQVLEREGRVGGRVLTVREPFADGLYAEAGGEFVDGGHAVLHDFLQRYSLPVVPIPSGQRIFSFDGTIVRGDSLSDLGAEAARDESAIERETARLAERVDDPARPWESAPDLDRRSMGDWLDGLGLGRTARLYQRIWRSVDYGAPPEQLSLLQYARDERLWQRAPDLISGRVLGGMDRLPRTMAAELGDRVHLSVAVNAIHQTASGVTVEYDATGQPGALRAQFAVVALPPAALRHVKLEPPLPGTVSAAHGELAMGRVTKILIQVTHRFWERHGLTGRAFTDGLVQATYETTAGQAGERAVLTVYTADRTADTLAVMTDDERLAVCRAELERLYPGCSGEIEQAVTVAWTADSWPGGAYSHFRPGDVTRFGPWLTGPVGRLHLAGEHTDQWQATMNGALASGQRAAREILDRLG
jgi:monoamine oxidase